MRNKYLSAVLIAAILVSACGGGSETTPTTATPPAAPTGLTIAAGDLQITPSWAAVSGATSYNAYYRTSAGVTIANGTKVTGATSGSPITGLTNGTQYFVAVTAVNADGESALSGEAGATPVAPSVAPTIPVAPTGVVATAGNAQVTISWAAVSGAASYNVYWGTAAGVTKLTGTKVAGHVSGSAITGLTNGTAYYFVLTAVNTVGESAVSSEVSATPQLPATTYATADLGGSWYRHRLQVGANKWVHGPETVDPASGYVTNGTEFISDGSTVVPTPFIRSITADGIIAESDFPTYHGRMSKNKNLIVGTGTPPNNAANRRLVMTLKQDPAITFATSDLAGTWDCHRLGAGTTSNWNHNVEVWDASGNSITTEDLSSDGTSIFDNPANGNDPYTNLISSSGVVTTADPDQHGTMSISKDLVVITRTAASMDVRLIVCQKRNPATTFALADLAGTWDRHLIRAGTTNSWEHAVETWDANGKYAEIFGEWSEGGIYGLKSGTYSISATGVITDPTLPTLHGVMSASKDLVVMTRTAGNGVDVLFAIHQKR